MHDFALDRDTLKAGPCFPVLQLYDANDRLSDHCVHRPKPTKSAGKSSKAPAAAFSVAAADGAGAGAGKGDDESGPPQQKKAKHEEAGIAPNDTARLLSVIESNALNDQSVSSRIHRVFDPLYL